MEWSDFEFSPVDDSLYDLLSSPDNGQFQMKATEWSFEDNKLFENALAEIEAGSPGFIENVASRIPWKSLEDIKSHYEALIRDIEMIETGHVPVPDYQIQVDDQKKQEQLLMDATKDKGSPSLEIKTRNAGQQRKRGVPWTENEHHLFLMGLNKYGKGDWRSISRYYVITKTPTQVASHAQKYYRRQTSSTPADRRRPSIHDIQTVNLPTFTSVPQRRGSVLTTTGEPMPFSSSCGSINPMINYNFNGDNMEQNPMLWPRNSTAFKAIDDDIFNQSFGTYPS